MSITSQPSHVQVYDIANPPRHPWRRFFARHVDSIIYLICAAPAILIVAFLTAIIGPKLAEPDFVGQLICIAVFVPVALLIETILLATWGTTPGKRLFGLKVHASNGDKLNFQQALVRCLWFYGLIYIIGFIPIVAIIIIYIQYRKLRHSGYTSWDRQNKTIVCLYD